MMITFHTILDVHLWIFLNTGVRDVASGISLPDAGSCIPRSNTIEYVSECLNCAPLGT